MRTFLSTIIVVALAATAKAGPVADGNWLLSSITPTVEAAQAILKIETNDGKVTAVVTTDGPGGRYGATVSAFSSVSADPPTILVCLKSESRIARAVAVNGTLCVNVLPQGGADIAKLIWDAIERRKKS